VVSLLAVVVTWGACLACLASPLACLHLAAALLAPGVAAVMATQGRAPCQRL
jgi:hypothetical protein